MALAASITLLASKAIQDPAPPPQIPSVTINTTNQIPETKETPILFAPNIQPTPIENVINVPEGAPTINENHIHVQPADVTIPRPVEEIQTIERGRDGEIKQTRTQIKYEGK